jgi:hypothetical protein
VSFFEVNDLRLFWRAYGRDAKVIDWLDELTAECPKDIAQNMNDPCGARCPDLPAIL